MAHLLPWNYKTVVPVAPRKWQHASNMEPQGRPSCSSTEAGQPLLDYTCFNITLYREWGDIGSTQYYASCMSNVHNLNGWPSSKLRINLVSHKVDSNNHMDIVSGFGHSPLWWLADVYALCDCSSLEFSAHVFTISLSSVPVLSKCIKGNINLI